MLCGGVFVCCHTVFFLLVSDGLIVIVTDKFLHALTDFLCFLRLSLSLPLFLSSLLNLMCSSFPRCQTPCRDRARPSDSAPQQHLAQELWIHTGSQCSWRSRGAQRPAAYKGGNTGADPMQSQRQEGGGRLAGWYQGKDQIFSSRATALIQGSSNRTNKKDVDQIYSCQDGEKEQNITYRVFWGLWNPLEKVWCRFTYLAELNMSSFIDKNVIFTFQFMLLSSTGREEIFLMDMHKIYRLQLTDCWYIVWL